ncbi:branched-chain amino acid ABC transporter permease [halophilic archaeon]|nr:branched-chain amino acid ABC transporter permease [halophilic archaeon]
MVQTGILNAAVTGIVTGSVIALGAIGLSLVYSIAEVPNFAHGELLMVGAYMALLVNQPGNVPVYELLATNPQAPTTAGFVVMFLATVGAVLALIYHLGGREALAGSWWPVEPPSTIGYAGHLALAAVVGGLVLLGTPSIAGGMLFSVVVMAAIAPVQEKVIFQKFRNKGVELATMLIVALGLSFVLRFGTQALFGGKVRDYTVPSIANVFGTDIPLSAAQFFDFYATGAGITVDWKNSGAIGQDPFTVAVVSFSWPIIAAVVLVSVGAAVAAYRWRTTDSGFGAEQTFGPRAVGFITGLISFTALILLFGLGGSANVPDATGNTTRISLSMMRALVIVIAVGMMTLLHVLLQQTKLGTAMRASSDNLDLAQVTGIDTDTVMMATWVIAGAYAAIGGVMLGILFSSITPNMGFFLLLPMFAGVILGGIGSVYGAILGSYVVGLSMEMGTTVLNIEATYRIPIAFIILFIVLLVKPEGIMGGK